MATDTNLLDFGLELKLFDPVNLGLNVRLKCVRHLYFSYFVIDWFNLEI